MRRRWLLFPICLLLLLVAVPFARASLTIRVDEAAIRIIFEDQSTLVSLPVANALGQPIDAQVQLELIDTDGTVDTTVRYPAEIKPGANTIKFPIVLPHSGKSPIENRDLIWYRLRYRITPAASSQIEPISGVISLSENAPEIFALQVAAPKKTSAGASYRVRVGARHPLTAAPVSGVIIEATIDCDGYDRDDIVLKQSARTGADGFATLDFQIPSKIEDEDPDLTVVGRRGVLQEKLSDEIEIDQNARVLVTTDKPLYQPGQTLHTRVLIFDSSRHAVAGQPATLEVLDQDNATVFRSELTTSRFGVAGADWAIPENSKLGDYRINVELEGDNYEDASGDAFIKISRYDLPNFTVNPKPDRLFYLPGQNASVEVRADYLFGQPVKRGHVRVVRETSRHWDYQTQKWETEEGDKYEGEVDEEGRFLALINLEDEHKSLAEDGYLRYRDLTYAAYFTDATTNRTEQRRFDLRLTANAIHIYVIENRFKQTADYPIDFYVSTSYADGSPLSCDVDINRVLLSPGGEQSELKQRSIRTNKYGVAKVSALPPVRNWDNGSNQVSLLLRARDAKGDTGEHGETIYLETDPVIRVETDKTFYRDGEAIRAEIRSSRPKLTLMLDVVTEGRVLQSESLQLHNGSASIVIPYRKTFSGAVTIAAYSPVRMDEERDAIVSGSRTVLYPHDSDLRFKVALNQESYRPGEEASARFLTRTAQGTVAESALGIVIFDKAVEERARTDSEFTSAFGFSDAYRYLTGDEGDIAGVTRKDLDQVDLSKPLPEGFDLCAELLLNNTRFRPNVFGTHQAESQALVFGRQIELQLRALKDRLDSDYQNFWVYPTDESALKRMAALAGTALSDLRDPWDSPYQVSFFAEGAFDVLELTSAGADKHFQTADDLVALRIERPYFRVAGEAINRAVTRYHARTGKFIRDESTLKAELQRETLNPDAWRDPWGQPYRFAFSVNDTSCVVQVLSSGPDKQFSAGSTDDELIWTSSSDYSRELRAMLESVLRDYAEKNDSLPQNPAEFDKALKSATISPTGLLDPWGHSYYLRFNQTGTRGDRVEITNYTSFGRRTEVKTELTPVTRRLTSIYVRSAGPDGKEGTADDFEVTNFSSLGSEQTVDGRGAEVIRPVLLLQGSAGAISGTIIDPNGAVVAGANVVARNINLAIELRAVSDESGVYTIRNAPAGIYRVTIDSPGFQRSVFDKVPVHSSSITRLNASLNVAAVASTVTVTGGVAETVNASSTSMSSVVRGQIGRTSGAVLPQISTPRLREYFPETLVWQPSLETDKQGRAQLKFKLADNITTWKMSVIASTEDGQIGTIEKEIKSFQPFFVELDPPRVLTEGDEISLPVVVRNYLDHQQTVNVAIKPESWFALLGSETRSAEVPAGDAARAIFDLRAEGSVKDGKQRITAIGGDASDAIEKPVTVHPDGEEQTISAGTIAGETESLRLDIPNDLVPNSARAELKIYPNLLAHVAESVEAILQRPHGCGEQTISSTYPSLLLLRNLKQTGQDSPLRARAQKYLREGYERLRNYRDASGGFTYWGDGEPDLALTAYALRFLSEARELIPVDEDVLNGARAWLVKQQRADGSWAAYEYGNQRQSAVVSAFVARVLAMSEPAPKPSAKPNEAALALQRALNYLDAPVAQFNEPYLIASYALAAAQAGDSARAAKAVAKLRTLAREANGAKYWDIETNTPFHGWGLAGQIEATALVIQALARVEASPGDQLIRQALLFLLREKDRYGVWYSTQATINVLDALLTSLAKDVDAARTRNTSALIEILINGRRVKTLNLPQPHQLVEPITIDLSQFVIAGPNQIEVRRTKGSTPASMQAVAAFYVPWSSPEASARALTPSGLRLVAKFDKTEGAIGETITCHVEAERNGSRGYGMMLAEIGLPPGADVDRESLVAAMSESNSGINQYDILPDRVLLYLWPRAGGTKLDFKFRPRFGIKAQTAPSTVYDYYNPDARATVAPVKFVVR